MQMSWFKDEHSKVTDTVAPSRALHLLATDYLVPAENRNRPFVQNVLLSCLTEACQRVCKVSPAKPAMQFTLKQACLNWCNSHVAEVHS